MKDMLLRIISMPVFAVALVIGLPAMLLTYIASALGDLAEDLWDGDISPWG